MSWRVHGPEIRTLCIVPFVDYKGLPTRKPRVIEGHHAATACELRLFITGLTFQYEFDYCSQNSADPCLPSP